VEELLRTGPFAGPEVDFVEGFGARKVAWLKSMLNWALPPSPASIVEPAICVPEDLPVHRPEVIVRLAAELPDPADALRYRDNFARLLPQRIQTLNSEIRDKDQEAAVATLLSLNVGSSMVGAPRLQHVVDRCLADVRNGRRTACLPTLVREAERFLANLAEASDSAPMRAAGPTDPGVGQQY
jgi:hypothetical protein